VSKFTEVACLYMI